MAVKTSGQLSLRYDIMPELPTSYVNLSLRSLSSRAGFTTPDAMSEFYGYSNNAYFVSAAGGGFLRTSTSVGLNPGDRSGFSFGLWFRNNAPTKRNQNLMAVGRMTYGQRGYVRTDILVRYLASLNRIKVEIYSGNQRRMQRDYPLHDNPNVLYTGITSSGNGWRSSQRGNTDANGFSFISVSVDLNNTTATNAIKLYWNSNELTYSVANQNSSRFPTATINAAEVSVGESLHQAAPSGGSWYGDIDNAFVYPGLLGQGVMNSIWLNGNVSPSSYFTNNALTPFGVWAFENDTFLQPGGSVAYRLLRGGTISFGRY